jgi:uncharacterized protein with HEPN domain
MDKNPLVFVHHIFDALERIEKYLNGLDFEKFLTTEMVDAAVVRELEIIGEAARNLPKDFQEQYPEIPWAKMISLRNRVIHGYFDVDLKKVWSVCQNDLPKLKEQLEAILKI